MKISARNNFKGKVTEIKEGVVTAKIKVDIGGGHQISSTITMDALNDLGIQVGSDVSTLVKSSNVILMTQ